MSKADYLKRYMTDTSSTEQQSKKRKKSAVPSKIRVVDSELEEWKPRNEGEGDQLWGANDAPVVVDDADVRRIGPSIVRGSWAPVTEVASSAGAASGRADGDDAAPPRRASKRHDSDSDDAAPPRRDSKRDSGQPAGAIVTSDSSSVAVATSSAASNKPAYTASGHMAGLQSGPQFRKNEERLVAEKNKIMAGVDASQAGKNAETTYRDKKGKKLDMLTEFMRQQAIEEGKAVRLEKAAYDWGKGTVQKESAEDAKREMEILAAEPFARMADDPRMEAQKKREIRDGDPMAEYFAKKQMEEKRAVEGGSQPGQAKRSVYKGPAPPPNRFNIMPGYRWDGVDRGNQWEGKVLKKANSNASMRGDRDSWAMADM